MEHFGRIEILSYNVGNEYKSICRCPHCGKEVLYGDMMMNSGIHCCSNCNLDLYKEIQEDKEINYELYVHKAKLNLYEPYRYRGEN